MGPEVVFEFEGGEVRYRMMYLPFVQSLGSRPILRDGRSTSVGSPAVWDRARSGNPWSPSASRRM